MLPQKMVQTRRSKHPRPSAFLKHPLSFAHPLLVMLVVLGLKVRSLHAAQALYIATALLWEC